MGAPAPLNPGTLGSCAALGPEGGKWVREPLGPAVPLPKQHSELGAARDFQQHSLAGDVEEGRREGAGSLGARRGSPFAGTPRGAASQWDLHTRGVTALLR